MKNIGISAQPPPIRLPNIRDIDMLKVPPMCVDTMKAMQKVIVVGLMVLSAKLGTKKNTAPRVRVSATRNDPTNFSKLHFGNPGHLHGHSEYNGSLFTSPSPASSRISNEI
eukprot:308089_1